MLCCKKWQREKLKKKVFPDEWREILNGNVPYYRCLPPEDREELHGLIHVRISRGLKFLFLDDLLNSIPLDHDETPRIEKRRSEQIRDRFRILRAGIFLMKVHHGQFDSIARLYAAERDETHV